MCSRELMAMDAIAGPNLGYGQIISPRRQMCFSHFRYGGLRMRAGCRNPCRRRSWIVKTSKVNVISALSRNSVIVGARRRNALHPKLLEALQRRTIYNDNHITVDSEVGIDVEETANEETDNSLKADDVNSEAMGSEMRGLDVTEKNFIQNGPIQVQEMDPGRSKSSLKARGTNLWDSWKDWNARYRKDIRKWGVGRGPIFVISESAEGEVLKVSIDEAEIRRRCGAEPFLADYPDETAISISDAKIAQARQLALDIETGAFKPPRNSTVFEFVCPAKNDLEKWGALSSVFCQPLSVIGPVSPTLKISLVGFVVMSGFCFVCSARKYIFSNAQLVWERIGREKQKILMGNVNSVVEKERDDGGVSAMNLSNGKGSNDEAELRKKALALKSLSKGRIAMDEAVFEKRVLEIRAMARQARKIEQESSQLSSKQQEKDHPSNSNTAGRHYGESRQDEKYSSNFSAAERNTEDKAKMDQRANQRDVGLQIEPENLTQKTNNVLSEEAEELHWMREEVLRKIVFKVQANEKAGREPFYGLVSEEEQLFFRGLERKFEREGEEAKTWIKERVENLEHGKDAVEIDDPPEAFTACWKDSNKTDILCMPEKYDKDCQKFPTEGTGVGCPTAPKAENTLVTAKQISTSTSSATSTNSSRSVMDARGNVEENMEEVSQVLSKGLQGQLENYERLNTEMKKESEMYKPEKLLNKDSECKQELQDHLWWLKLRYVLCIALYRNNEGEVLRGLYSLDMTPGIQSASKHYHTIAFQDRGDATNFCHILQSHFEELENIDIHVILRSTKEFYEEAKSKAFKVTIIKKHQLQLYVGQSLKEVESRIIKIGSAMYHDKPIEAV